MLVGVLLGSLPLVWLMMRRKRRLKTFATQLPDALEMISRTLRAGQSLAFGFNRLEAELGQGVEEALVDQLDALGEVGVGARRLKRALEDVNTSTGRVSELVEEIAIASAEQSTGIGQINTAVTQMDTAIQASAASAEEIASSAEEMAGQAESMRGTVTELTALPTLSV